MERFIFGTYKIENKDIPNAIKQAYEIGGISRFDTAQLYKNEESVGNELSRYNNIEVTTKIRKISDEKGMIKLIEKSSKKLPMLNSILLHIPRPTNCWKVFEKYKNKYNIGVSNYGVKELEEMQNYSTIMPSVNQIEFHPFCSESLNTLEWCNKHNIKVQAHTILANCKFFNYRLIIDISVSLSITPAQVMLRWAYQHGVDLVVSTLEIEHINEWLTVPSNNYNLSDAQMGALNNISKYKSHSFYPILWTPWMWVDMSTNKEYLTESYNKILQDKVKLSNGEYVSELAVALPGINKLNISPTAKCLAKLLFPKDNTFSEYKDLINSLRDKIYEQRRTILKNLII